MTGSVVIWILLSILSMQILTVLHPDLQSMIVVAFAQSYISPEEDFSPMNATSSISPEEEHFSPMNSTSSISPEEEHFSPMNATSSISPEEENSGSYISPEEDLGPVNVTSSTPREELGPVNQTTSIIDSDEIHKEKNNVTLRSSGSEFKDASLLVNTNRDIYISDQVVVIFGSVSYNGDSGLSKILLEIKDLSTNLTTYKSAKMVNGYFRFDTHPGTPGTYNATVSLDQNGIMESASTLFRVTDLFQTRTAIMFYISIGFLAGLLLLICFGTKNATNSEILRFVFLSGIVGSILSAFVFTDLQVGNNSPLGLVIAYKTMFPQGQWVLNIGGEPGSYSGGIQIPVYVVVFGLVGGYLRYLYKTSRLLTDPELKREKKQIEKELRKDNHVAIKITRLVAFYQSLKDITLFFLAPLLAIATWFILSQWQTTENSVYTLAVVSFAAGLITDEIIATIIRFTKRVLKEGSSRTEEDKTEEEANKTEEDKTEEEANKTEEDKS